MVLGQIHFIVQTNCWNTTKMDKRHAVAFSKGLPGAKKIRSIMHEMPTPEDFANAISEFLVGNSQN